MAEILKVGAIVDTGWRADRWFRIVQPDGSLWMETSDEGEALRASRETGWPIERLFSRAQKQWRRTA